MTRKVMLKQVAPETDAQFKEPVEFLDSLIEFSAFGRVNINFLRGDKAFKFSPDIFTPPSLGVIKEFGYGLGPIALKKSFYKMVEDLTVALLKILVLHEAFVFRTSSFMVRIVRPWNRYPRYFWREEFYLWNGYEKAEVKSVRLHLGGNSDLRFDPPDGIGHRRCGDTLGCQCL